MNNLNGVELKHSYRDIIQVFLINFLKDFDCKDVEDSLRLIFTKKEVDDIINAAPENQIYILFWKLHEKSPDVVNKFVENESNMLNYGYLMSAIRHESRYPRSSTENYISEKDRLYNDNQKFTKYNVSRIEPYLELRKALLELRPARNVAVGGVLGAGKQWLVLDVCSSYDVQRKMDFKIFWLNVRDCRSRENQLEMLQSFLYQIAPNLRISFDQSVEGQIERVKSELRHLLKDKPYKNCLLVLRNVQNKETWEAFNLGCKILLTTRRQSVIDYLSPETTKHVTLPDVLTASQTESLFAKYLPPNLSIEYLRELANFETTNPLMLSLIAKNIRDGLCTLDNWKNCNCTQLETIIRNSLNELHPEDRGRFVMLSIFPESAYIPIKLLGLVWSLTDPVNIVNRFYKYSLVDKHPDDTISLPSIYSMINFAIPNEAALSKKIVDAYNIPQLFNECKDVTLEHLDCYFYSHIGHHLSKISNKVERVNLFRIIFLDFRFLEQKIRNDKTDWNARGSILHTLHILQLYKDQIVDNDSHYKDLLNDLLIFLTKAEEKLISSPYSSLLQIALISKEGPVYEEALRQVQKFPDYVWFTDHGRFHQHREIINSGEHEVHHVIYLNDYYCLMALGSQQLRIADVSLAGDTTYLLSDEQDPSDISRMCVFNNQMQLLTLHKNGSLKLWSFRTLLPRRTVRPSRSSQAPRDSKPHCYEQLVNSLINSRSISAFYIDENVRAGECCIQLHVAFENGDICILNWDDKDKKFSKSQTPILPTKQTVIRHFSKIFNRYYVVWSDKYMLTFWNLKNGSKAIEPEYAPQKEKALTMETYSERLDNGVQYIILLIIYEHSIWQFKFKYNVYGESLWDYLEEPQLLQLSKTIPATITCGKLSTDGRYLVIGTLQGLVVYDLKLPYPLLRSNVSDPIVCLDIYDLNHDIYKYFVLCGAQRKHFLHFHTLRSTETNAITWLHHVDESDVQLMDRNTVGRATLEPNVYLRTLLEITSDGKLYVVDSRARIYQIQPTLGSSSTARRKSVANWSTIDTRQYECGTYITTLCATEDETIYAGYNNGLIVNISDDNKQIAKEDDSIEYLKVIKTREPKLMASSHTQTVLFALSTYEKLLTLAIYTMYTRPVFDDFVLLFTDYGLYSLDKNYTAESRFGELNGFDLKDNLLYLATSESTLEIYDMNVVANQLEFQLVCSENIKDSVNQLAASKDGQLIALGFKNGSIELYSFEKHRLQHIYTINKGHDTCNSMQLRFSPCKQILVSCAEQLCFWNMKYIRNNQVTPETRSMRRFHLQEQQSTKGRGDMVDAARFMEPSRNDQLTPPSVRGQVASHKAYLWDDKRGHQKLPELLACIKFVGNEARHFYTSTDFTQFYVIDDEGVFYHLKVFEGHSQAQFSRILEHMPVLRQIEGKKEMLIDNDDEQDYNDDYDDNGNNENDGVDVVGGGDVLPADRQSHQI